MVSAAAAADSRARRRGDRRRRSPVHGGARRHVVDQGLPAAASHRQDPRTESSAARGKSIQSGTRQRR